LEPRTYAGGSCNVAIHFRNDQGFSISLDSGRHALTRGYARCLAPHLSELNVAEEQRRVGIPRVRFRGRNPTSASGLAQEHHPTRDNVFGVWSDVQAVNRQASPTAQLRCSLLPYQIWHSENAAPICESDRCKTAADCGGGEAMGESTYVHEGAGGKSCGSQESGEEKGTRRR
jgi:hypothetical protein